MASGQEARCIAKCLKERLHQVALLHSTIKMHQLFPSAVRQLRPSSSQELGIANIEKCLISFGILHTYALSRLPQCFHPLRLVDGIAELSSQSLLMKLPPRPEQHPPYFLVLELDDFCNGVSFPAFLGVL